MTQITFVYQPLLTQCLIIAPPVRVQVVSQIPKVRLYISCVHTVTRCGIRLELTVLVLSRLSGWTLGVLPSILIALLSLIILVLTLLGAACLKK